ncbi:SDR family oxidoreductase [Nonomuraea sp. NPDC050394]|uniref:SDR family oxidoreductase n=1 Tax=Nonomuraea sp. NPDC050394 TaxID=3364363 RepID=UPI00378E3DA0
MSGIGEATARLLAWRGAAVVLGARRTERLDKIAHEIRDRGGRAVTRAVDVTAREDLERLVGLAVTEFGRLDVLVGREFAHPLGPRDQPSLTMISSSMTQDIWHLLGARALSYELHQQWRELWRP